MVKRLTANWWGQGRTFCLLISSSVNVSWQFASSMLSCKVYAVQSTDAVILVLTNSTQQPQITGLRPDWLQIFPLKEYKEISKTYVQCIHHWSLDWSKVLWIWALQKKLIVKKQKNEMQTKTCSLVPYLGHCWVLQAPRHKTAEIDKTWLDCFPANNCWFQEGYLLGRGTNLEYESSFESLKGC